MQTSMEFLRNERLISVFLAVFLLAGCAEPQPAALRPVSPSNLTAYATQTIPVKPTPIIAATETVSTGSTNTVPSPTPSTYTIKRGDTLLEIARRSGISLAELLAANPGISPEALSVGQVIQIPAPRPPDSLPPPAAAELGQAACYRVGRGLASGGGVYCFVPARNPGQGWLENVKVQVTLLDAEGRLVASQEALPPLTGLPAGKTLPAVAFFPDVQIVGAIQAQLLTAIQTDSARYLPVELKNLLVAIAWGGLSAQVEGQARLAAESKPASTIWLAGVAYDAEEKIVAVRRWQWSGALAPGESLPFRFMVYSAGAPIARVEVLVEARP
jgi:LysM repeat protein